MLRSLFVFVLAALGQSYPLYLQFEYVPGVEYDLSSNVSFIRVQSVYDMPLYIHLPHQCNGAMLSAKKVRPSDIRLKIPCDDSNDSNDSNELANGIIV